jgi:hypothetical protein
VAILVVGEATGVTAEQDAALAKKLYPEGSLPAGFRIRMAGPMADGWRIVTLWDSEADWERSVTRDSRPRWRASVRRWGRSSPGRSKRSSRSGSSDSSARVTRDLGPARLSLSSKKVTAGPRFDAVTGLNPAARRALLLQSLVGAVAVLN